MRLSQAPQNTEQGYCFDCRYALDGTCLVVFNAEVNCTYLLNTTYSAETIRWNFRRAFKAVALNYSAGHTDQYFSNSSLFAPDLNCLDPHCLLCTNVSFCEGCVLGYLNIAGYCMKAVYPYTCKPVVDSTCHYSAKLKATVGQPLLTGLACQNRACTFCLTSAICLECDLSFSFMFRGICLVNQTATSTECPFGETQFGQSCAKCSSVYPGCVLCSTDNCIECAEGLALGRLGCAKAPDCAVANCQECLNSRTCVRCEDPLVLSGNLCLEQILLVSERVAPKACNPGRALVGTHCVDTSQRSSRETEQRLDEAFRYSLDCHETHACGKCWLNGTCVEC